MINKRLILIYFIIIIKLLQDATDFQLLMFTTYPPSFKCDINSINVANQSHIYRVSKNQCTFINTHTNVSEKCTKWIFDKSQIHSTVVTDFNLVCQFRYLQLIILPLYNMASLSIILTGFLSDYYGRKRTFIIFAILDGIFWVLLGLLGNSYVSFMIIRMLKSMCGGLTSLGFVIVSEITPKEYMNLITGNYYTFYGIGIIIAAGIMKIVLEWKMAWLISSIPSLCFLFAPLIMVESPRWLIINNRKEEAKKVLQKLDQFTSDKDMNKKCDHIFDAQHTDYKVTSEFVEFITKPTLLLRIFVLIFSTLTINLVYQGVATNLKFFYSDIYINTVIMGLVEIPSGPLASLLIKRSPVANMVTIVLVGVAAFTSSPVVWNSSLRNSNTFLILHTILGCLAKLLIVTGWNILVIFFATLIPTKLRSISLSTYSLVGSIGSAIGGFLGYYYFNENNQSSIQNTTNIIYGVLLIISLSLCGLVLPSVPGNNPKCLPHTSEEANMIKKEIGCICWKSNKDYDELE